MLRITAISAGAVEYLIKGSGCTGHDHAQDLDRTAGAGAERAAGAAAERGGQGPAYFGAAVAHGEPQGAWAGSGLEAMGLGVVSGETVRPEDVRAIFGQLRRPSLTDGEEDVEFLGRRPPTYRTEEQRYEALVAKEPGGVVAGPERERELRGQAATDGRKGVAYYDFTFSAPKSVSVYWAALLAAGADGQAAAVAAAHDQAVRIAVEYADGHVAHTRTGWHGRTTAGRESVGRHEEGRGTVWSLWRHSTSRENEPQLHTHGALLNRTVTGDGKIRALDGAAFRGYKEAIATAYERALEQLVTDATGARFALRPDGVAREIVGVDPELMAEASSRRGQVAARVADLVAAYRSRHGREPSAAARKAMADMATLDTRRAKGAEAGPAGVAAWGARRVERLVTMLDEVEAAAHRGPGPGGHGAATAAGGPVAAPGHAATAERDGHGPAVGDGAAADAAMTGGQAAGLDRAAVMAAAVADVQAKYSVWTFGNLVQALDARLGDAAGLGVPAAERPALLESLAWEAVRASNVVLVSAADPVAAPPELCRSDGGSIYRRANGHRFATVEHLAAEDRVVGQAAGPLGVAVSGPEAELLRVELQAAGLSADQVDAVAGIVGSGRVGDVLVGPAGTGKSRTVGELARVWSARTGGRVLGVATSEIATQNLAGDGLEAINSTRFLRAFRPDPETGQVRERLRAGDMVVVDEAGMSSTRDLSAITELCARAGAKVVYTGDQHQLGAVEAGGLFAHLYRTADRVHELREVHRFRERWERRASLLLRDGDLAAVDAYGDRGRLHTGTVEEMEAAAAEGYVADTVAGKTSLLIVGTNQHATQLSNAVRTRLMELGRVDEVTLERVGPDRQKVSVGDRVQARMNNYSLRVDPPRGRLGRFGRRADPVVNRALYTVVGRDEATGDLLVEDKHGAVAHLPADYVAEHVTLAYAVTVHAAQGVTVDTDHAIVDRDADREALYPALTRGRDRNTAYLVTERAPDAHDPERLEESARERLAAVMGRSGAQVAAAHVREQGEADSRSLTMAAAQWDAVTGEYARARYARTLEEVLGPEVADRVAGEAGYGRLLRAVREAELAGHNAETVLVDAATSRGFGGAESVSDVLRWRLRNAVAARVPEQQVDPSDWTTLAAPLDGPVGEYAQALAVLAGDRQQEIGAVAAAAAPEWATRHLGPVPDAAADPAGRADWERRAGIAGAYRELHQVPDDQVSLGEPPSRDYEFHRALWAQAREALGNPPDVVDHEALSDAELYGSVERWGRQQAAAPAWVAEDLAAAHRDAHRHEAAWNLAAYRLTRTAADDPAYGSRVEEMETARRMADWHAARVADLEHAYERRAEWAESTRDDATEARLAAEELARRGLPPERAGDAPAPQPEHVDEGQAPADVDDRPAETAGPEAEVGAAPAAAADVDEAAVADVGPGPEPEVPDQREVLSAEAATALSEVPDRTEPRAEPAAEPDPAEGQDVQDVQDVQGVREDVFAAVPEPAEPDEVSSPVRDVVPHDVVPEPGPAEATTDPVLDLHVVGTASRDHAAAQRGRQAERDRAADARASAAAAADDEEQRRIGAGADQDLGVEAGRGPERVRVDYELDEGPGLGL